MELINNVLSSIGGFGQGVATSVFVYLFGTFVFPKLSNSVIKFIASKKQDFFPYLRKLVQDQKIRETIKEQIFVAQKYLGTDDGKQKFEWVKDQVLNVFPDILDPYVDRLIQEIYNEIQRPIQWESLPE